MGRRTHWLIGTAVLGIAPAPAVIAPAAATPVAALAAAPAAPAAGPGREADYLPADKTGYGTSRTTRSLVWFTLQGGRLSEIYYPDISTPATRSLEFVVTDGRTFTTRDSAASVSTTLVDGRSPTYRQVATDRAGRWRLTRTYVTDPDRSTVLVDVAFQSLTRRPYRVYALFDPDLSGNGNDDSATGAHGALLASDASSASAMVARPAFTATSSGFLGTGDGWTDLAEDHRMDWRYPSATGGNVVQTGLTTLDGVRARHATVALGFGGGRPAAAAAAGASLGAGYAAVAKRYATGWHDYLAGLNRPPASLRTAAEQRQYVVSQLVLAAGEDKTYRGAFVASPSMPWAWAYNDELAPKSGPYHLVWPRDQYQMATALLAAGDRAAAGRALDYMFTRQQQPDGHLPQNTYADGRPYWTSIQLDQTADPIVLAWQLGRKDAKTWAHVKKAADFMLSFELDGNRAPWTQQERWEEQSGYSPSTIAAEIAGLVCAAEIARANGDTASADRYLTTADAWRRDLPGWTVTTTGPYSPKPYYVRLTKDGDPDAGTTYDLGNSGPKVDQRSVVDAGFLELVRLGVVRADDPVVLNSLAVVDRQLSFRTPVGRFWHRYTGDGYGETATGAPWDTIYAPGTRSTTGRLWPIFAGERGEYELLAAQPAGHRGGRPGTTSGRALASAYLASMAAVANRGGMMPEQVWDQNPPSGKRGFTPGTPTFSATPLMWTHAQYVRLAWSIQAGSPVERPSVVAQRYGTGR